MLLLVTVLGQIIIARGLTCDEILELPENKKVTLSELQTMTPKDTVQCIAYLGKEQLLRAEAVFIWQSVVTFYSGVANVPDEILMLLHWVTPALTQDDYANMTLNDIDVVQNFGLDYGLDETQLSSIAELVRKYFASKTPEDYTFYDLIALRQILCAFNQSEIERIHPSEYREAAMVIGHLKNCKAEVMQGFATLAIDPDAFGPPEKWSTSTVETLGEVAKFLSRDVKRKFH